MNISCTHSKGNKWFYRRAFYGIASMAIIDNDLYSGAQIVSGNWLINEAAMVSY